MYKEPTENIKNTNDKSDRLTHGLEDTEQDEILQSAHDDDAEWGIDLGLATDEDRVEEFLETRNPYFLTPELALKMKLPPHLVEMVPDATDEDIEKSYIYTQAKEEENERDFQEELKKFGIDDESLEKKENPRDVFMSLLGIANSAIDYNDGSDDHIMNEYVQQRAREEIIRRLLANEGTVQDLFEGTALWSADGIHDVGVFSDVFKEIHETFHSLSNSTDTSPEAYELGHRCADVLNDFSYLFDRVNRETDIPPDLNYLAMRNFMALAEESKYRESRFLREEDLWLEDLEFGPEKIALIDYDTLIPFEISNGKLAIFSADKTSILLYDGQDVEGMIKQFSELKDKIVYKLSGQEYALGVEAELPLEYADHYGSFLDQCEVMETETFGVSTDTLFPMTDFMSMQRKDVREMIESDFNVQLKDLPLREQFYFFQFLQDTENKDAEKVAQFTSRFGVDGMRTFLSLERGDDSLGEDIISFGQYEKIAERVFRYYGELLESAERAEILVRDVSACEGDACVELAEQVRENILNRAQKDLEEVVQYMFTNESAEQLRETMFNRLDQDIKQAIQDSDSEEQADEIRKTMIRRSQKEFEQAVQDQVATRIETYVASAKEYVALLQEVGAGNIESIPSGGLHPEDQQEMMELLSNNYDREYQDPEEADFKSAVKETLKNSFTNPNTTFQILRDKEKIVSFNRFDTITDHTGREVTYFGSFNADPAYSGVGGVMLEETIKDRLKDERPMMAYTDPSQAITKKYIEDGFVAIDPHDFAGKDLLEIWRSIDSTTQLKSKEKTVEELLASPDNESFVVREQSDNETYPELHSGMGLTRYFSHHGKDYLVFESLPDTLRGNFVPPQEEQEEAA